MTKKTGSIIILLCFLTSIGQLATVIYLPSMPAIAQNLHATATATELTLTLYMLAFGLSQLVYGPISDLFGRKNIILIAMLVYIAGSITSALAPSMTILLIARFIEGFGAGGITALARASGNDLFTGHKLTQALTYTSISASLASMLSPTLGGFIQQYLHWRTNFWVLTGYTLLFLLITLRYFPNIKPKVERKQSLLAHFYYRYKEVLTHHYYICYALCAGLSFSIITAYYVASPFIFQHQLHLLPSHFGMLFLVTSGCYIIGGLFTNYFPIKEKLRFWLGIVLLMVALSLMVILGYSGLFSVYVIVIPMALAMFSISIVFTTGMTSAVRLFKHIAGTAAAMLGCIQILNSYSLNQWINLYFFRKNTHFSTCFNEFGVVF